MRALAGRVRRVAALLAIVAGAGAPARLAAQSHPVTIDRIVAVVGSKPILWSQLQEQMVAAQAQGQALPTDSTALTALRHQVLQSMVEEELIVQEAQRDTNVKVTDQEVQDQVEQTVQNVRRSYPNRDDFVRQLHLAGFDHERDSGTMARTELKLRRVLKLPVGLIEREASASSMNNSRHRKPKAGTWGTR